MRALLMLLGVLLAAAGPARAIGVDDGRLPDPAQEAEARAIMEDIRCLVCQNQSIEDSNADLAADLRHVVRDRVAAGDSPKEVKAYLVARYGDWVLLNPPFKAKTLILWLSPAALLILGIFVAYRLRKRAPPPAPLSADEERAIEALLKSQGGERR